MKILLVGAGGVLGSALLPLLSAEGHDVIATTRSGAAANEYGGRVQSARLDLLNETAVNKLLRELRPEVVVNLATSLPAALHPRRLRKQLAETNRIRSTGSKLLAAAAQRAGVRRIVATSIAFAYRPGVGPAAESEPLIAEPLAGFNLALDAIRDLESTVLYDGHDNVVLRLGMLYGPGTAYASDSATAALVRRRQFPVIKPGEGCFSFLHVNDATSALQCAIHKTAGLYNICEDVAPAVAEWLPAYAAALKAPAPIRLPRWIGRLAAGSFGDFLMNRQRCANNECAKRELGWRPENSFMVSPLG